MSGPGARRLDAEEREELLGIARGAIEGYVRDRTVPEVRGLSGRLAEAGAAFVTLKRKGRLRGCIGFTEARAPLFKVVQECAVAAATEDPRFPPVTPGELSSIALEISVLTPPVPVSAGEVEVGRHGLVVSHQGRRGLLLPQVPVEQGWDRETFLDHTCMKAGLPPDAWRRGAALRAFTAEVFGEPGGGETASS